MKSLLLNSFCTSNDEMSQQINVKLYFPSFPATFHSISKDSILETCLYKGRFHLVRPNSASVETFHLFQTVFTKFSVVNFRSGIWDLTLVKRIELRWFDKSQFPFFILHGTTILFLLHLFLSMGQQAITQDCCFLDIEYTRQFIWQFGPPISANTFGNHGQAAWYKT